MTPIQQDRNDSKLLLASLALVLAAAGGLAMLVGFGSDREEGPAAQATPAMALRAANPEARTIEPAAFERALRPDETDTSAIADEVIRVDPTVDFVKVGLESYRAGDYPRAVAYLEAEVESRPGRAWTLYMLGLARWKDGDLDPALENLKESAELDPSSIKTFVNLSRIRNDRAEFEEALEAADAAVQIDADQAEPHFLRARSLHNLGRMESALEAALHSVELDPDNAYAQNLAGLIYIRTDRSTDAVDHLERAIELSPDIAFIRNNLGMALELGGRFEEAVAAYRRAAEDDPEHVHALANLARLESVLPLIVPEVETDQQVSPVVVFSAMEEPAEADPGDVLD